MVALTKKMRIEKHVVQCCSFMQNVFKPVLSTLQFFLSTLNKHPFSGNPKIFPTYFHIIMPKLRAPRHTNERKTENENKILEKLAERGVVQQTDEKQVK